MKNKLNFLLVILVMFLVIGCSCGTFGDFGKSEPPKPSNTKEKQAESTNKPGDNSNKSLVDKATDVVTTGEKIGVQECDDLMDAIRTKIENDNTDFVTKTALKVLEGQFRSQIKRSLEENNADRQATAALCKELKKSWDEQEAKQPAK